jgi:hypothetical protein
LRPADESRFERVAAELVLIHSEESGDCFALSSPVRKVRTLFFEQAAAIGYRIAERVTILIDGRPPADQRRPARSRAALFFRSEWIRIGLRCVLWGPETALEDVKVAVSWYLW